MQQQQSSAFKQGLAGGVLGALLVTVFIGLILASKFDTPNQHEPPQMIVQTTDAADVVEDVNDAVVSIVITQDVPIIETYYEEIGPFGFQIPRYRERGTEEREVGGGSGFLVSSDGYIVTNAHVVDVEDAYFSVFMNDEQQFDAEVIASDRILDIAVIKIEGADLPFLTFGDSDSLRLGEGVIAIGNALGEFRNTVSTGVVSGLSRNIVATDGSGSSGELEKLIQTDAAINPGNSGGPLINYAGEVVGMNVAVATGSENIGFSIPSNTVSEAVEFLKDRGKVIRPFLGVRYVMITPLVQQRQDIDVDYGALIVRDDGGNPISPGSPAEKAGLQPGDIILEVGGVRVEGENDLSSLIRSQEIGESVDLLILRDNEELTLAITLEEMP